MVDTKQMLSIDGELSFPNQPVSTLPTEVNRPDTSLYEVKQFMKLVIKGASKLCSIESSLVRFAASRPLTHFLAL